MRSRSRRWFATALFAALTVAGPVAAQENDPPASDGAAAPVVVATKPLEPFVFVDDQGEVSGHSIDLWNEVADRVGVTTNWRVLESVGEIIDLAASGDADLAIAGISMTPEREAVIDFSHPYYDSGLQVATTGGNTTSTSRALWDLVTSRAVVVPILGLVGLVLIVAHLVWLGERRTNPQFPHAYRPGIGEALWWSTVSVITGGEAVKEINRPRSRILAVMWMLVGLVLLAYVTAQAASSLTVRELESDIAGVDDLGGLTVGTVEGTVADDFLAGRRFDSTGYRDIEAALEGLDQGAVDAVVYDSPILAYRASTDFVNRIELVGPVFSPDPYAIALAPNSALREPINAALLAMFRDGTIADLELKWFGQTG